jgi:hypothetical protein
MNHSVFLKLCSKFNFINLILKDIFLFAPYEYWRSLSLYNEKILQEISASPAALPE